MYTPKQFEQTDPVLLLELMQQNNFATLISTIDGAPCATHAPVLTRQINGVMHIEGHLARANPHWQAMQAERDTLVIFHGPHTYISPTLYRSSAMVPTWNYMAVHASGRVVVDHSSEGKLAVLGALVQHHEPEYQRQFDQLDPPFRQSMLNAIVAFDITVSRLEGKFKLGQHRLAEDRPEMRTSHDAGDDNQRAIAQWMRRLGYWE